MFKLHSTVKKYSYVFIKIKIKNGHYQSSQQKTNLA